MVYIIITVIISFTVLAFAVYIHITQPDRHKKLKIVHHKEDEPLYV